MKNPVIVLLITLCSGMLFLSAGSVHAQPDESILVTKHNLSISGPGAIKAVFEKRVCIFCHTPHRARGDISGLWNRDDSSEQYVPYDSSTMYATVGQPTGASKLCLSCHDGTIALGALVSETQEIAFAGGIRFMPEGQSKLGSDLSDDHPISFTYNSALASSNLEIIDPSLLPSEIKLDKNSQLQCTTCHDPHNNVRGKFLVLSNSFSNLCRACHEKNGWALTAHSVSNATWNNIGPDPWPHTTYTTVAENACENCHKPHSANGPAWLLNELFEEDNCIFCHNGNVAATNMETELTKPYRHDVQNYNGIHEPLEDVTTGSVQDHVECTDCHNPHWSNSTPSLGAPLVSGANQGVTGINLSGQAIQVASNQYEICFKCHADNNVLSVMSIDRDIQQLNTRMEFDSANPSYHPVEFQGVNTNVPSLLPAYTTSSKIFCTDCHNSDSGPAGPHGSFNEYLLELNYSTQDFTVEDSQSYALCYKCHDRNSILADESFSAHNSHIVTYQAPCSACHDAHGISYTQGNSLNNSHLINFDINIVLPEQGTIRFDDTGTFSGQCTLNCHASPHNLRVYP